MQWPDFLTNALQELDGSERQAFLRILVKLIRRLQVDGEIVPQRLCVTCAHFQPNPQPARSGAPYNCGLLNLAMSDIDLRLDCAEHRPAGSEAATAAWQTYTRKKAGT